MEHRIIAIDQSTSATKALLFDKECRLLAQASVAHRQYYPQSGYVEHDAEEIYQNMVQTIRQVMSGQPQDGSYEYSLAITNQRETVVVWNRLSGKPVCHALVWQDTRGEALCKQWRKQGLEPLVEQRCGLKIDPSFCASKIRWILDHVEDLRDPAGRGDLLAGTIDCWLIWKLTGGRVFATDYTNASRTMFFNIHTLAWDEDLLKAFDISGRMLPEFGLAMLCMEKRPLMKSSTDRFR